MGPMLTTAMAAILDFQSMQKKINFAKEHPLIIHVQVGFNHACCLKEKAINHFPIGSID